MLRVGSSILVLAFMMTAHAWAQSPQLSDFARPAGPAPTFAFNPSTPEKAALGRTLFFDPRLSQSDRLACATCHLESEDWADTRRFSLNDNGDPLSRRTPPLVGVGWAAQLGWTVGVDSLEGFSLLPIAKRQEMGQDLDSMVQQLGEVPQYQDLMRQAFGTSEIKISRISQSLAAFMRTLVPRRTAFDDWVDGDAAAVSESAKKGFALFVGKAGCVACHVGWRFTDDAFHDIGLPAGEDMGRAEHDLEDPKALFAFKTPTLRGTAKRSFFMHDGSLESLADVLDHYTSGIAERDSLSSSLPSVSLTPQEKLNVLDFLSTL